MRVDGMRKRRRRVLTLVLLGSCWLAAGAASALEGREVSLHSVASVRYEDNVGFAQQSSDKVDDFVVEVGARIGYLLHESDAGTLELEGRVSYERFVDLGELSRLSPGGALVFTGRTGAGFDAPWYELSVEANALLVEDSDIRDGYEAAVSAKVGKVFTGSVAAFIGYRGYLRRSTDDDIDPRVDPAGMAETVFDLVKHDFVLHAEMAPTLNSLVYAEYTFRTGDTNTTGAAANFNFGNLFPRALDTPFGPGQVVWRVEANTHIGELGFRHQPNEDIQLELSARYVNALVKLDNDYEALTFNAEVSYRF